MLHKNKYYESCIFIFLFFYYFLNKAKTGLVQSSIQIALWDVFFKINKLCINIKILLIYKSNILNIINLINMSNITK